MLKAEIDDHRVEGVVFERKVFRVADLEIGIGKLTLRQLDLGGREIDAVPFGAAPHRLTGGIARPRRDVQYPPAPIGLVRRNLYGVE